MRKELAENAREAYKVPTGFAVARPSMRLPLELMPEVAKRDSEGNGKVYQVGLAFEANGYLMLYDLIEALGGRIITTIIDSGVTIVTRHKTYEGKNQAELLLQIIRDRLQAIKENGDEPRITG
jgi:hypothetical protein